MSLEISNIIGRTTAAFFPHVKVISFEHMTYHSNTRAMLLRLTSPRVDASFADSDRTQQYAHNHLYWLTHIPPEHHHIVPVSMLTTGTPREPRTPQSFEILSVGRFEPQKNYLALVAAVANIVHQGMDVNLTIAGKGFQLEEVSKLAHHLGIEERVYLPGHISDSSVLADMRRQADIYIQPSRDEGLCRAVAEALAAAMPTIATATGGIKDYGPEAGILLIEKPTIEAIQSALVKLITNYGDVAHVMSAKAVAAADKFFILHVAKETMSAAQRELVEPRVEPHESPIFKSVRHHIKRLIY